VRRDADRTQIVLKTHGRTSASPGDNISLDVDPAMIHVFDQHPGRGLRRDVISLAQGRR